MVEIMIIVNDQVDVNNEPYLYVIIDSSECGLSFGQLLITICLTHIMTKIN